MMTHAGTRTVETERLLLRKFAYSDDESMLRNWAADEKVQSMYAEPTYATKEEVRGLLDKYIGGYKNPNYYRWGIFERGCQECIGQIAYFLIDEKNHFGEIEYCIGEAFQRKGYATEATKAVIAYGFERLGLHKVQISHMSNNIPSRRVIEKCGFCYEGKQRDYFFMNDQYVDRLFYSILEDEWLQMNSQSRDL